jgi:O-antigen/teichoic acid export membrane protein
MSAPIGLPLRHNFSWTLGGNVSDAVLRGMCLVILARYGSPEAVGNFALGFAISAPIVLFVSMQLSAIQATDALGTVDFNEYLGHRLAALGAAAAAIVLMAYVTTVGETRTSVLLIGAIRIVEGISEVFGGMFQRRERMDLTATSQVIRALGLLGGITAGILGYGSLNTGLAISLCVSVAALIAWDVRIAATILSRQHSLAIVGIDLEHCYPRFRPATMKRVTVLALPLAVVSLLDSLNANLPRYLLQFFHGEATVGYFAAIAYFMVAGSTIVTAMSFSTRPRLAHYFSTRSGKFRPLFSRLVAIAISLGILGVLVAYVGGEHLLRWVYGPSYASYHYELILVMVAAALWYIATCVSAGLTSARIFRVQPVILAFTLVTGAVVGYHLVPGRGIAGAAMGLVAASTVRLLLAAAFYLRRVEPLLRTESLPGA